MFNALKNYLIGNAKDSLHVIKTLSKWLYLGCIVGLVVGIAASLFGHTLIATNNLRTQYPLIVLALPFGGLVIAWLYKTFGKTDRGTNTVIASIHSNVQIPFRMAPMIFLSTTITHLCGGSAGREGAALQLGGSIAGKLARWMKLTENSTRLMVLCGMSAGFSALFGTPLAAAVFSMEVVHVGVMHYSALVPCVTSAMIAHFVAGGMKIPPEVFPIAAVPEMTVVTFFSVVLFAAVVGAVSILFCHILHQADHLYQKFLKHPYLRIFIGGCLVVALSALPGGSLYLGSGMGIIEEILHHGGSVPIAAFFLKMVFTALTLGAGFKGGEIVPSFTVGAAFGCVTAAIVGLPMELIAACGMVGVFCGVTNSPITSLLVAFELFGFEGMPYYLVTIAVSYLVSGHYSLYHEQRITHSKAGMTLLHAEHQENG